MCHRREEIKLTDRENFPTPSGWSEWKKETTGSQSRIRQICPWCDVEFERDGANGETKDRADVEKPPPAVPKPEPREEKPESRGQKVDSVAQKPDTFTRKPDPIAQGLRALMRRSDPIARPRDVEMERVEERNESEEERNGVKEERIAAEEAAGPLNEEMTHRPDEEMIDRADEEKPDPIMVRRVADGRVYYATLQPGGEWYLRPTIGDRTMMYVSPDHFRTFYRNLEDTLPAALDGQWHRVLDERDWRVYEAQYVVEQDCEMWKVRGMEPDRSMRSFPDETFQKRFRKA
jgi:hypothetical protein